MPNGKRETLGCERLQGPSDRVRSCHCPASFGHAGSGPFGREPRPYSANQPQIRRFRRKFAFVHRPVDKIGNRCYTAD